MNGSMGEGIRSREVGDVKVRRKRAGQQLPAYLVHLPPPRGRDRPTSSPKVPSGFRMPSGVPEARAAERHSGTAAQRHSGMLYTA